MAIQRLTLGQIETAILQAMGYSASSVAPWSSSSNLYLRINEYVQRLPQKISAAATQLRQNGSSLPYTGIPRFDMWRTSGTLTVSMGSATVYFPADYDAYISFTDQTNNSPLYPVDNVSSYYLNILKNKPPGPPEAIDIGGYISYSGTWVRKGTIYPSTVSTVTPSIAIEYWRIPAAMPGLFPTTEYPDIDPKYEQIIINGVVADCARSNGQEMDRFSAIEKEMLVEMAYTARGI